MTIDFNGKTIGIKGFAEVVEQMRLLKSVRGNMANVVVHVDIDARTLVYYIRQPGEFVRKDETDTRFFVGCFYRNDNQRDLSKAIRQALGEHDPVLKKARAEAEAKRAAWKRQYSEVSRLWGGHDPIWTTVIKYDGTNGEQATVETPYGTFEVGGVDTGAIWHGRKVVRVMHDKPTKVLVGTKVAIIY